MTEAVQAAFGDTRVLARFVWKCTPRILPGLLEHNDSISAESVVRRLRSILGRKPYLYGL